MHNVEAPTLTSSYRDPSVQQFQTPVPTISPLSLNQRIASVIAAMTMLSMNILTASYSSGRGQRMVPASRPRLCSFLNTPHISVPNKGSLYVFFCVEPTHAFAVLAVNRCYLESRATGAGVIPESHERT